MEALVRLVGRLPPPLIKFVSKQQWRHPLLKRAFDRTADLVRHRTTTIPQGVGRGLRFHPGGTKAGYALGTSEPGLQNAFALFLKRGMTVVDAGANVGFHSVIAARLVGPEGGVLAVEPVAENISRIEHNASLNGFSHLRALGVALGDADGEAVFQLSEDPAWGRLSEFGVPSRSAGERRVAVRHLDALVEEGTVQAPDLVKIDVEGAEVKVLAGASATLRSARPVLFIDLHGTNDAIADQLDALDYEPRILGGASQKIRGNRWDLQVIAVPRERADLLPTLERVADPAIHTLSL